MGDKLSALVDRIIKILIGITTLLLVFREISDQIRLDDFEHLFYTRPNAIVTLVMFFVMAFLSYIVWGISKKFVLNDKTVFLMILLLGCAWILITQVVPESDANYCLKIAAEFNDRIFFAFEKGQYLDIVRHNIFFTLFLLAATKVAGTYNYLFVQAINALVLAWAVTQVYKFLLKKSKTAAMTTFFLIIATCPIWMQVNFVFANTISMSLGAVAIIKIVNYFEDHNTREAIIAAVLMGLSCQLKGIAYIYLIAICVLLVVDILKKNWKSVAVLLLCLCVPIIIQNAVFSYANHISGNRMRSEGGCPTIAWIVMGMQLYEGNDTTKLASGWYNGYHNYVYRESGYDASVASAQAKKDLEDILTGIKKDPIAYVKLLAQKNHSMWNEPTFDVLYRNNLSLDSGITRRSDFINSILSSNGALNKWLYRELYGIQILIYFGVFLYVLFDWRNKDKLVANIGLLIFVGGYVFFFMWEAKSEYGLMIYVFLLAYAATGLVRLFDVISGLLKNINAFGHKVRDNRALLLVTCVMLVLSFAYYTVTFTHIDNDAEYEEYKKDHWFISSGDYDLVLESGMYQVQNVFLDFDVANYSTIVYDNSKRKYNEYLNWDSIDVAANDRYATSDSMTIDIKKDDDLNDVDNYTWKVVGVDDGVIIKWWKNQNMVWTYDPTMNTVVLSDFSKDNMNQIWRLR